MGLIELNNYLLMTPHMVKDLRPAEGPPAKEDARAMTELTDGGCDGFSLVMAAAAAAWAAATASCCSMVLAFRKFMKSAGVRGSDSCGGDTRFCFCWWWLRFKMAASMWHMSSGF